MILTKHKNELLTIIQKSGLDPTFFDVKNETIDRSNFFVIQLRNSPIRFALRPTSKFDIFEFYRSTFSPNFPFTGPYRNYDIGEISIKFKDWLNTVVKPYLDELSTPDLWQTIVYNHAEAKRELVTPDDFEPFSKEEKLQLKRSINELRLLIETSFEVQKTQLAATNKLLDHLSDAVDKQNKLDWRGIAISVAFNIAANLALNPEQVRQLFDLFQAAFSNIIYLLP